MNPDKFKVILPADLPIMNGRAYYLDLAPEELAQNVVVVGDPDRGWVRRRR